MKQILKNSKVLCLLWCEISHFESSAPDCFIYDNVGKYSAFTWV